MLKMVLSVKVLCAITFECVARSLKSFRRTKKYLHRLHNFKNFGPRYLEKRFKEIHVNIFLNKAKYFHLYTLIKVYIKIRIRKIHVNSFYTTKISYIFARYIRLFL